MKKFVFVTGYVLFSVAFLFAQPKPKQSESAPTQKEMEEMMREAQKEMDNLDPETKRMMDSMGIKVPSFNSIPQVTDAQLQEAYENENRIVPEKDAGRIAGISKIPLTNASMPAFLSAAHNKVSVKLGLVSKTKGEEIYQSIKTQHHSPVATGNTAAALWMMGKAELALYVAGKACIDDPTNTDNINNYAAMLSMSGAEQLSIPLLNSVNKRFPKNSTVLNNIGQAWFGLGDIDKANNYLDSAIRIYAYHPQANYTKSFIEESKDHEAAAVEAVKRSIRKSYSMEKQERLKNLGYKLKSDDLDWDHRMPQDPLGLEKFNWPEYPKNVNQSIVLEKEWNIFKEKCEEEIAVLREQQKMLEEVAQITGEKRMRQLIQASQKGQRVDPVPPLAPKAMIKLKYLVDGKDGHLAAAYQRKGEALVMAYSQVEDLQNRREKQIDAIRKKYEDQFGEGKPNPFDVACGEENAANNTFLTASNSLLQQACTDYLNFVRRKINDETYYYQYTMWPEEFEVAQVTAKLSWLLTIHAQKVMFQDKGAWCQPEEEPEMQAFKLAVFDDVHCMYHSEFKSFVGSIRSDCSRTTTELDLKFLKLGLKQDMDQKTFADQFMTCSVEVGAGVSVGSKNLGPLKGELSAGGSLGLEFDRTGLTDVIIKGAASASLGTDVITDGNNKGENRVGTETKDGSAGDVGVIQDLQVEAGVKGQVSIISGKSSVAGTGILSVLN